MTIGGAISELNNLLKAENIPFYYKPSIKKVIETIEQDAIEQSVLDNIKAEIEQNAYPIVHGVNNHEKGMTLYGILQVIDKYKAESEEV